MLRESSARYSGASSTSVLSTASNPAPASRIPWFTAAAQPALRPIELTRAPACRAISGAPSVDPLSTATTASTRRVWASSDASKRRSSSALFHTGTMAVRLMRKRRSSEESLLRQEHQVVKTVLPGIQLGFSQPRRVHDRNLAEADIRAEQRFDLD